MVLSNWLGSRLRLARLSRNMTTSQVAKLAGMSRTTYEKLEQGDDSVSLAKAQKAMDVLFLDVSTLSKEQPDIKARRVRAFRRSAPQKSVTLASREAENEAVQAVLALVKERANDKLTATGVKAADVAALLALVGDVKTSRWHGPLQQAAREMNGEPQKAVKHYSVGRLLQRFREAVKY